MKKYLAILTLLLFALGLFCSTFTHAQTTGANRPPCSGTNNFGAINACSTSVTALKASNLTSGIPKADASGNITTVSGSGYVKNDGTADPNLFPCIRVSDYSADTTGASDCTSAIQSAITAAQAANIRTVYLGKGTFKCNIVVPTNITLIGAGGGFVSNFTCPTAPFSRGSYPTVLIPNSTSLAVVRVSSTYGVNLESFAVIGTTSQLGTGIMFTNNTTFGSSTFPGSNMSLTRVRVTGFNKGVLNYGATDVTYRECLFTCSVFNVYMTPAGDGAPSDTQIFLNCVTGGSTSTWCFYFVGCRGTAVISGDHNLASHIMYIQSGGVVNWVTGNSEQIQSNLFELQAGYLNIQSGRFNVVGGIGGNAALLHVTGTTVDYTIGTIVYDGTGAGFLSTTYGTLIKTAGTEYPRSAPSGFLIQRYTSTAFSTLSKTEFTTRVFRPRPVDETFPTFTDHFINNYTTPFGALGWTLTTTAGTGGQGRFPSGDLQNMAGALEFVTLSGSGSDAMRLAPAKQLFSTNLFFDWEMSFVLNVSNAANTKLKAGLFSNDVATITGATNATPIVITTSAAHGLIDGMPVFIASVAGNTNANGSYYADQLSSTTFALYTDVSLTTGRAGSGAYTSGGTSIAATPANGIGIGFDGATDTNIQLETWSAGVRTQTSTGVAIGTLTSATTGTEIKLRRLKNASDVFIGYSCQIGSNPETLITTTVASGYLIPAIYLGSANANFATCRIDKFTFKP